MSGLIRVENIKYQDNPDPQYWEVVPCCTCGEDTGWRAYKMFGLFNLTLTLFHYCICCRTGYGCEKDREVPDIPRQVEAPQNHGSAAPGLPALISRAYSPVYKCPVCGILCSLAEDCGKLGFCDVCDVKYQTVNFHTLEHAQSFANHYWASKDAQGINL